MAPAETDGISRIFSKELFEGERAREGKRRP